MGRHGVRYAEHIRDDIDDAALVAASRRDPERLEEFGGQFDVSHLYTDYRKLVGDPEVEAVIIVTPNDLHAPIALAAAEQGKHILVEKPIARNVEEARLMVEAARENEVKLMVSQNFRYHPLVRRVKSLLDRVGNPYLLNMCKRQQRARGWREDPEASGGGALMDLGVHIFDQARFLLDREAKHVACFTRRELGSPVEDSFASVIEFPGCLVTCDASMCSGSRVDLIEIATDGGQILADRYARRITLIDGLEREVMDLTEPDFTIGPLLKDFVRCVLDDTEPPVTGRDGMRAVEIAEACYESARSHKAVGLPG
jgi:predicted dehydrogenase